jgi:hypothetical protein
MMKVKLMNSPQKLGDRYLERMKAARNGSAVLKIRLANLKSSIPRCLVFAFEGIDDKTIYFHWIRRIKPELQYEPFPCDGKDQVLQLREILERDLGDISENVYFFVDRDFDDLRGRQPSSNTFMTDRYSVENYLVCKDVVFELLKNEFHCNSDVSARVSILEIFEVVYAQYLVQTELINFRLFLARRLNIRLKTPLPDKVGRLASVLLETIHASSYSAIDIVQPEREPSDDEKNVLFEEFNSFNRQERYRGKFALLFFLKWLENLALDRNSKTPKLFGDQLGAKKVKFQNIGLDSLASKAHLPLGLRDFLCALA